MGILGTDYKQDKIGNMNNIAIHFRAVFKYPGFSDGSASKESAWEMWWETQEIQV